MQHVANEASRSESPRGLLLFFCEREKNKAGEKGEGREVRTKEEKKNFRWSLA